MCVELFHVVGDCSFDSDGPVEGEMNFPIKGEYLCRSIFAAVSSSSSRMLS